MLLNSVHILVAIRRDFPPRTNQLHKLYIVGGRGLAFLNSHFNEEMEKMLIRLAKCKLTGEVDGENLEAE